MILSEVQKDAKIAYLTQRVHQLEDALLDAQIQAGVIRLDEGEGESDG